MGHRPRGTGDSPATPTVGSRPVVVRSGGLIVCEWGPDASAGVRRGTVVDVQLPVLGVPQPRMTTQCQPQSLG